MKRHHSILTAVYIVALSAIIAYGYFLQSKPVESVIRASVEAPEIRISAKIPGRIASIDVQQGDQVNVGDTIFRIESPELEAKREQALALIAAKNALKDRAIRGAREEEIAMARDQMQQAETAAELAEKSLQRLTNLFAEGLVPEQKLDEAQAQANAATFAQQAATQRFTMATNGTEGELIKAAESDLRAAQGVLAEVKAALAETHIQSHKAGQVSSVLIHEGEISPAGFPVVTMVNLEDAYLRLHVNELQLRDFNLGAQFSAYLPALDLQAEFKVSYVSAMGDYANWQATKPGEYDLKTFEIQAKPIEAIEQWRVGMTAVITPQEVE